MAVFLLDTDMLSLHQRNQSHVIAAVDSHATDQLCVSTVTLEEQIGGWSALARSAKTPQAGEHAAMLLASLVVSWDGKGIAMHAHQCRRDRVGGDDQACIVSHCARARSGYVWVPSDPNARPIAMHRLVVWPSSGRRAHWLVFATECALTYSQNDWITDRLRLDRKTGH